MGWRWFNRIRLFGGLNANMSASGVGWSWGFSGFRIGVSPNGRRWISVGVPGTGLRYFKYISGSRLRTSTPNTEYSTEEDYTTHNDNQRQSQDRNKITKWKNLK